MPPLEHMGMVNNAVLWTVLRHDRDGFPLVTTPVEVCCRWEEKNIEMVDPDGNRILVDVILAVPQQIAVNSLMWEGKECDLPESGIPTTDLYEVVARDRGDSLTGRVRRWEFGLKRYKDRLPRLVT